MPNDLFLSEFETLISTSAHKFNALISTGDFNMDFSDHNNSTTKGLIDIMTSYTLEKIVQEPTRYGETTAKTLYLIFVTYNLAVKSTEVVSVPEISDHCMVTCPNSAENNQFDQPLHQTLRDFFVVYESNDIDEKINIFNTHAPIKMVEITKAKEPWITSLIRVMMSLQDRDLSKKNKVDSSNTGLFTKTSETKLNML
ncbi:hypothetical protein JTB14_034968 [Gonioctena quinquepunctata]|nr:hypothetical protein JTB14_034968 [Gonioctena quinquepunctata]